MTPKDNDLTEKECKQAFSSGKVLLVQANPNDMSIEFITHTSDRGLIVRKQGGAVKRYKNNFDRDLAIAIIKGL